MGLRELLIDFARATAGGGTLPPEQLAELEALVRDVVLAEWQERGDRGEIPVGVTSVIWKSKAAARMTLAPELVRDIENKLDSSEVFDATVRQLNRLLRRGMRGAEPRLAQQVLKRLARGDVDFDPRAIVADAYKYSVSDAIRTARRRNPRPRATATATKPTKSRYGGVPDRLVLLRSVDALARIATHLPGELAFCVVRDYSRGLVPRERCAPFLQLPVGASNVSEALARIDDSMSAFSMANEGTRRKDPRLTGIGDRELARILLELGQPARESSIPTLAKRYRARCDDFIRRGGDT